MALAQQLAELAVANSQGLLNDDEYRLLRQNLFEQHSDSALVPVEAPVLSVAGPGRNSSSRRVRIADTPIIRESPSSHKLSAHRNNPFTASVTSLLKRGSGDKVSPDVPSTSPNKLSFIPRWKQKASKLLSGSDKRLASSMRQLSVLDSSRTQHPPTAPSRSSKRTVIPTFPSAQLDTSSSSEIFDDRNLSTVKDIRAAIIATEAEAERLLEAFNDVESLTSFRATQQNARRLRAPTPEHITAAMDGSNWRKYAPAQFSQPTRNVYYPVHMGEKVTDNTSVRSISLTKTGVPRSKSTSSLRSKQNPPSALSSRVSVSASSPPHSILRKGSSSSIASQARVGVTSSMNLQQSNDHLALYQLSEAETEDDLDEESVDMVNHPEVSEIQRRRDEVITRYDARLGYLKAKLKSAELHERLLR